jgi:hypothetical protein
LPKTTHNSDSIRSKLQPSLPPPSTAALFLLAFPPNFPILLSNLIDGFVQLA